MMLRNEFQSVKELMYQLVQGSNNSIQAKDTAVAVDDHDIIIIGGRCGQQNDQGGDKVLSTVEEFNTVKGQSTQLPRMNHPRTQSASCVYNGNVIVTGGDDGQDGTDTIEVLDMNQHPLKWTMHDAKLPIKVSRHTVVLYQDKLFIIGGYNWSEKKISDEIYELALSPPYTANLLTKMPQPRRNHRAEIVDGRIFILGGRTTGLSKDANGTVVVYDFAANKVEPIASLPKPVCKMSTVTWGNMIIVIGGKDENGSTLHNVTQYDTQTGESVELPPLVHKRRGSSAVIMGDVIVVLGGCDEKGCLNSVERFTIGADAWKELPKMRERRKYSTAVVKPCD